MVNRFIYTAWLCMPSCLVNSHRVFLLPYFFTLVNLYSVSVFFCCFLFVFFGGGCCCVCFVEMKKEQFKNFSCILLLNVSVPVTGTYCFNPCIDRLISVIRNLCLRDWFGLRDCFWQSMICWYAYGLNALCLTFWVIVMMYM